MGFRSNILPIGRYLFGGFGGLGVGMEGVSLRMILWRLICATRRQLGNSTQDKIVVDVRSEQRGALEVWGLPTYKSSSSTATRARSSKNAPKIAAALGLWGKRLSRAVLHLYPCRFSTSISLAEMDYDDIDSFHVGSCSGISLSHTGTWTSGVPVTLGDR